MRIVPVLLVVALLAPGAAAAAPKPEFPAEMNALGAQWIAEQEALITDEDRAKPWFEEANGFLARAKAAQADGRFRQTMFHLETFHELLTTGRLMDEAREAFPSEGDQRVFALQRLRALHSDGELAWLAFREKTKGYDDQIHSLLSMELTLYAADVAIGAEAGAQGFDLIAADFQKRSDFSEGYVLALARASATTILVMGWANDIVDLATRSEGLPPKIVEEGWSNVTVAALASGYDRTPPDLEVYEELGDPVRANGEKIMSVAFYLATLRQGRISEMNTIFGDASRRDQDVLNLSKGFMSQHYNNTTLEMPRGHGLAGVFTSDAVDRADLTLRYLNEGKGDISFVYSAWASLDHATYANAALARMSPIAPAEEKEKTPAFGLVALLGAVALLALARRQRA